MVWQTRGREYARSCATVSFYGQPQDSSQKQISIVKIDDSCECFCFGVLHASVPNIIVNVITQFHKYAYLLVYINIFFVRYV